MLARLARLHSPSLSQTHLQHQRFTNLAPAAPAAPKMSGTGPTDLSGGSGGGSGSGGAAGPPLPSPAQAIDFLTLLQHLKTQKRTGWVKRGVAGPESIADHMYRMGLMAMLVQGTQYDYHRCMKLALVHDVAEAIVGDITPTCGVSDEEKFALESGAVQRIKQMLGGAGTLAAEEIEELWHEYEQGQSEEARLVKDFDKLEMILQALEYEAAQGKVLQEFFDSTADKWRTELGRSWAEEILRRRRQQQQQQQEQQQQTAGTVADGTAG